MCLFFVPTFHVLMVPQTVSYMDVIAIYVAFILVCDVQREKCLRVENLCIACSDRMAEKGLLALEKV